MQAPRKGTRAPLLSLPAEPDVGGGGGYKLKGNLAKSLETGAPGPGPKPPGRGTP